MRPIDPRLLRYARSTRVFLAITTALGVVTCLVVIAQARVLSGVIVDVSQGSTASAVGVAILAVLVLFVVRACLVWIVDLSAVRASARAKEDLRTAALEAVLAQGPRAQEDAAATATLVTRGIDALDAYYSRYLPQLVLAVLVPVAVLVAILFQDPLSAIIVVVTLPLIPIFMILIGLYTRGQVDRQWRTLGRLSGHFLDLVSGLPTLKVFGRAKAQGRAVAEVGDRYRRSTMGVLRVSFLSSLVLELLATLSVALVAVSMGLRLDEGKVTYAVALFVLVLAPEAYLPLRLVGQHFHAAAEGLGAADRLLVLLEGPPLARGDCVLPGGRVTVRVDGPVVVRGNTVVLDGPRFIARPGTVTAVVGGSGSGKSTLLAALLGFLPCRQGEVVVSCAGVQARLADVDAPAWRARVAWLPQAAVLVDDALSGSPTVGDVVRLGRSRADDLDVREALTRAGLEVPLETKLAADGTGLSLGQLQRLALARVLVARADVVLMDEPSAALDAQTEDVVSRAVRAEADRGATVIVVAHRPALVDLADQIVRVEAVRDQVHSREAVHARPNLPGAGW